MIPMQTAITVTYGPYAGTTGIITGKAARTDLYVMTTTELVFYGKPFSYPDGTDLSIWSGQFKKGA